MSKVVLTTNKNYNEQMEMFNDKLYIENIKLLHMLGISSVKSTSFIALGNSISTGFSMCDMIMPFITRNNELYRERKNNNMEFYSFARPILNSEESVINWYTNNISHKNINKLAVDDIKLHQDQCAKQYWDNDIFSKYTDLGKQNNVGLRDLNEDKSSSNIIIYNGCTGTLMDTLFRGDKKDQSRLLFCFKKDITDLNVLLKLIYSGNPNTQVYVCGLPNMMGINFVEIVNYHIKKVCSNYPNAIFVNGASRNLLYTDKSGHGIGDAHHTQPEYLELYNNVLKKINDNYLITQFLTSVSSELKKQSDIIELYDRSLKNDSAIVDKIIRNAIDLYRPRFESFGISLEETLTKLQIHYADSHLKEYFYTNKEETIKLLEKRKTK